MDNPFCPQEMIDLAEKTKKNNLDDYAHIWLGEPVSEASSKLIPAALVKRAQQKQAFSTSSGLIIGLDVARFGDDKSVFCFRRGRVVERFETFEKKDSVALADIATRFLEDYQPQKLFMDIGASGAGVYDILIDRGFSAKIKGVFFGAKAINPDRYINKRAEMWDNVLTYLSQELPVSLPPDEVLFEDLTAVNKKYDPLGRLQLESKEDIKKRLGRSPDKADALALTFAEPVKSIGQTEFFGAGSDTIENLFSPYPKSLTGW